MSYTLGDREYSEVWGSAGVEGMELAYFAAYDARDACDGSDAAYYGWIGA